MNGQTPNQALLRQKSLSRPYLQVVGSEVVARPDLRQHYRLPYRPEDAPRIRIGRRAWIVRDLSEGGMKIAATDGFPEVGEPIVAEILFPNGAPTRIEGFVCRNEDGAVAVQFTVGVSSRLMALEQQRINAKYRLNRALRAG